MDLYVSALTAALSLLGMQEPDTASCYVHLAALRYPPLARHAQVLGSVTATFRIDPLGKAAELEATGHPLLRDGLANVIASTAFPQTCSHQTLRYTVRYHLAFADAEPRPADRTVTASPAEYDVFSLVPRVVLACPVPIRKLSLPRRVWRALRH